MAASTRYQRALLRRLHRSMETYGGPLLTALEEFMDARVDQTSTGAQIVATSANGISTTFAAPSGNFSQEDLVETAERLVTLAEMVAASESLDVEDEAANDALLDAMLERLQPAKSTQSHFTSYQP